MDSSRRLDMRPVLRMMVFLAGGACVPPEHVATGVAPTVGGPDGRPCDRAGGLTSPVG
jgi:hypothetical protein